MEDETILIAVPKMRPLDREVGANAALLRRTAQVNGHVLPPPAHATRPQLFGWQALPWGAQKRWMGGRGGGGLAKLTVADGPDGPILSCVAKLVVFSLIRSRMQQAVDNAWLPGRVLSLLS